MNRSILITGMAACALLIPSLGLAETFSQRDGMFSMEVPAGWKCEEKPGLVSIRSPDGIGEITIAFVPASGISPADAKQHMKDEVEGMVGSAVTPFGGTVTRKGERKLGGATAFQLDYLLPVGPVTGRWTYIVLLAKKHLFNITYGSPDDAGKGVMDAAIETLKF